MANASLIEASDGTGHSSVAATAIPSWPPPRAPLPPHRLAALANALGVSTPSPATRPSASFRSGSSSYPRSSAPSSEYNWRSPTPSSSSSHNLTSYSPSTSKFLLHVTPPLHLPHESNSAVDNSGLTPPPSNASGYHTQFRRGTLVPLHQTLQSQMVAIAKEYALPSTVGMILYLSSASSARPSPAPSATNIDELDPDEEEPGPRLSDDVWKRLWMRVLKVEREESLAATRSPTPNFGLGLNVGLKNSPYISHDIHGPLRPLFSPILHTHQSQSTTPSPSSPSSTFDLRSHSKSTAPSFSSRSQSEDTAETSSGSVADELESDQHADDLHLPGLNAESVIPILAKVEFDIDRRKAAWYEPWVRSRRMNQLKRSESRKGHINGDERPASIRLKLATKVEGRPFGPLSESPEHTESKLDDDPIDKKAEKKLPPPLIIPSTVENAIGSGDSDMLPYLANSKRDIGVYDDLQGIGEFSYDPHDPHDRRKSQFIMKTQLDEIEKALAQFSPKSLEQNHSQTDLSVQPSPSSATPRSGRSSLVKDKETLSVNEDGSPDKSTSLKAKHHTVRYENAQTKTQGKAKLNEEDVPSALGWPEHPIAKPAEKPITSALRKKQYRNTFKLEGSTPIPRDPDEAPYPPMPLSSKSINGESTSTRSVHSPPSPPRLVVNGISGSAPNTHVTSRNSSDFNDVLTSGSTIRKHEHEEEKESFSAVRPRQGSSPIIPLSPDPFGRFASKPTAPLRTFVSPAKPAPPDADFSRFSAESVTLAASNEKGDKIVSRVSVKSVKNLWRKSKKLSITSQSSISTPSFNHPPLPASAQEPVGEWSPNPQSPLHPQIQAATPAAPVHSRVNSAYDHFHFDQESPYPVRKSIISTKAPQLSISERPPSPSPPIASSNDRTSIRKSILKGWKTSTAESQPQGVLSEVGSSVSVPNERPRPNASDSGVRKDKRPSALDVAASMKASASSGSDTSLSPSRQVQYIQNGRVAGLSERRKSKPANTPTSSSTDLSHYAPVPARSPVLATRPSPPPRSPMSGTSSRPSGDVQPSLNASQLEKASSTVNKPLSYSYHALDHNGR